MTQSVILPANKPRDAAADRIAAVILALPADKAWRVEISKYSPTRSNQQCRYLNGVAYKIIGDAIGYERDDISEYLCGTYFGWKDKKVPKKPGCESGIERVPVRTTTQDENGKRSVLDKMAFVDYVAFVQRFAAGKGIYIPDPE